jgi:hypothetical protein
VRITATGDNTFPDFSSATYATFIVMLATQLMTNSILGRGLMFRAIGQHPTLSADGLHP